MAVRLIRQVMQDAGVPREQAKQLTYNSCRKFLPTACNLLQYDRNTAQAVGNWVENVEVDKEQTQLPVMPMSVHYSDTKALSSGAAKLRVLNEFIDVAGSLPKVSNILLGSGDLLSPNELTWDMFAEAHLALHPKASSGPASARSSASGRRRGIKEAKQKQMEVKVKKISSKR